MLLLPTAPALEDRLRRASSGLLATPANIGLPGDRGGNERCAIIPKAMWRSSRDRDSLESPFLARDGTPGRRRSGAWNSPPGRIVYDSNLTALAPQQTPGDKLVALASAFRPLRRLRDPAVNVAVGDGIVCSPTGR